MGLPSPATLLCLLVLGSSALAKDRDLSPDEENEQLTDFYNLLDIVDDSNLAEVENLVGVNLDEARVLDPDAMVVDAPALMGEELPEVQLEDEDEDEDEVMKGVDRKFHKRDGRRLFWRKAKKWAKRLERGRKSGDKEAGWWKEAKLSNNTGLKEGDPLWKAISIGKQTGHRIGARLMEAMQGKVKGKHVPHHKRRRKQCWWQHTVPLENRVAMICWKLEKPTIQRFLQMVQKKHAAGVGNVKRKAYRMQFVDRMMDCCRNNVTSEECFITLSRERIDYFCNNEMPLKPWAPAGPRHRNKAIRLASRCCEHAGEERYNCFKGSGHAPSQGKSKTASHLAKPSNSSAKEEDNVDQLEDLDQTHQAEPWWRQNSGRNYVLPISSPELVKCCDMGLKKAKHFSGAKARRLQGRCQTASRKVTSLHRKENVPGCDMAFKICCAMTLYCSEQDQADEVVFTLDRNLFAGQNQTNSTSESVKMDEEDVARVLLDEKRNALWKMSLLKKLSWGPREGKQRRHHKRKGMQRLRKGTGEKSRGLN